MTIDDLKKKLNEIAVRERADPENDHIDADALLLEFIDDPVITAEYDKIRKWYA